MGEANNKQIISHWKSNKREKRDRRAQGVGEHEDEKLIMKNKRELFLGLRETMNPKTKKKVVVKIATNCY